MPAPRQPAWGLPEPGQLPSCPGVICHRVPGHPLVVPGALEAAGSAERRASQKLPRQLEALQRGFWRRCCAMAAAPRFLLGKQQLWVRSEAQRAGLRWVQGSQALVTYPSFGEARTKPISPYAK